MNYFLSCLLALLVLLSCTSEKPAMEKQATASAAPAETPPSDMQETSILTSKFWVFENWIDMGDPADRTNIGRWYRFYNDGTYEGGHWKDQNDQGTWFLRSGQEHTNLFIDSQIDDLKDAKWQIQGIDGPEMSWVKKGEFGDKKAAMCKLASLSSIPTKKQYGLE